MAAQACCSVLGANMLAACIKLLHIHSQPIAAISCAFTSFTAQPWCGSMQVGDAAMVLSLSSLEEVDDRNLLAGSLMVLLEQDINQAQVRKLPMFITYCYRMRFVNAQSSGLGRLSQWFSCSGESKFAHAVCEPQELLLRSSRPVAALEMRQDLKHWPEALALAQRLAPDRVPALSKEHAAMLEMVGEYAEARTHYQQVLVLPCWLYNTVHRPPTTRSSPVHHDAASSQHAAQR